MHSAAQARDKVIKSWTGISEVALIKMLATKGENIDLCIEYWASKRKTTPSEYRHYFNDVVQAYVQRLLSERLVCKAETVLRNVERDVKCFFYQYACECDDADLSEFVLDHLRSKESQLYDEAEEPVLHFYWTLVHQLRECSDLLVKFKEQLPRIHIEALMSLPDETLQRLLVELYFANGNEALLEDLNKEMVWQFLVSSQDLNKLRRWCWCSYLPEEQVGSESGISALDKAFVAWKIDPTMYEFALDNLKEPCESLRNYFARAGYFFAKESENVPTVLRRLCTMQCLDEHKELLTKQPLAQYLLERGRYALLLLDSVPNAALEQLLGFNGGANDAMLTLIMDLKSHALDDHNGFETLSKSATTYLESTYSGAEPIEEHPLLTFYDFLCHEPNVAALEGFLSSSNLNRVPYLKSLMTRFDHGSNNTPTLPTPRELFLKFKQINLNALSAAGQGEIASFSNQRLCQRYARKSQLNYTHYLKQHRSAYAVYYLVMEQLQLYGQITRTQLFHACETATDLALQHAEDDELVAHCVACCEMLGFDSQHLRCFLLLKRLWGISSEPTSYSNLIRHWDNALVQQVRANPSQFPLDAYQALLRLAARCPQGAWPGALLQYFAAENDWWHLLVVLHYFDLPITELKRHMEHFTCNALGVHLLRALSYDTSNERQHKRTANRQQRRSVDGHTNSSQETITNSSQGSSQDANLQQFAGGARQSICCLLTNAAQQDLFAIVLCSTNNIPDEEHIQNTARFLEVMLSNGHQCTGINLLKHCVQQQMPVLAVLAATTSSQNVDWCWLVWLAVTTGQWADLLREAAKPNVDYEYVWTVIRGAVSSGHVNALLHSFNIFQQDSKFVHLCRFLQLTAHQQDFSEATIVELRQFFFCWSMDAVHLPLYTVVSRKQFLQRCITLLLIQLQSNFDSILLQQKFLDCICRSDVGDICDLLDFCLLNSAFAVAATWMRQLSINFELLVRRDSAEYKRLVAALTEAKAYNEAVQLAVLLQLPVSNIISAKWIADYEGGLLYANTDYEKEINDYSLPPAILVNFFLHAASQENTASLRKYELLQNALSVIKKHHLFPNEFFDRDQIEYDMVFCYLQLPHGAPIEILNIYHSEYFEQIMMQERCVLYKSFLELKELAGIDDLTITSKTTLTPEMEERLETLLNALLDKGDIVEALRLQELFDYRPNDLRFIVFAMALAEGVTTIFNLSTKERQLLSDIEKGAFPKFNRLTLNQNTHTVRGSSELSGSCSTLEFEEIPSKEKQETLNTLLGIGSKLKHGVDVGKRIVLAYRAAMYLDKDYIDVLRTKDASVLLKSAAEEECLQRLMVVSDIHISTRLTPKEIAESIALELTTCIVRPRFYIFHANQQPRNAPKNADLWGYNIDRDFHLFLELTPNSTMLGYCLLDYCDALRAYRRYQDGKPHEETEAFHQVSEIIKRYGFPATSLPSIGNTTGSASLPQVLSNKKQNQIYVELLIKAHHCFVHECSMEGIACVLHRAKVLNTFLTKAKSWSLIVRMLIGIARYREMFYCFDALIENEQFESLLGQFDEDQKCGLRQGILSYLREYSPSNSKDLLRLAALHFLMYQELAEMWQQEAQEVLTKVRSMAELSGSGTLITKLKCSAETQTLLNQALENYTHATENYLLDNKLLLAQQSVAMAELVAMQIDLCNKGLEKRGSGINSISLCVSVISVKTREEFRELSNIELSVPQTLILSRAYGYDVNWSEALLSQFILLQRRNYLKDYLSHQHINDDIIEQAVKGYVVHNQNSTSTGKHEELLKQLVDLIHSVTIKYKLASILGLKSIVMSLLTDSTVYYLRDTNFGRNESHNIPDM